MVNLTLGTDGTNQSFLLEAFITLPEVFGGSREGAGSPTLLNMLSPVWLEPLLIAKSQEPTAKPKVPWPPEAKLMVNPGQSLTLDKFHPK
jgi:hypothetical protein